MKEGTSMYSLFAFLSPTQLVIVLIVGVLIFGRRLPEVGRYLGKGIIEFKKGMQGLEDNIDIGGQAPVSQLQQPQQLQSPEQIRAPQRVAATAPKFEDNLPNISTPPRA
jgi:sec-independent protein translocase protein TatA